MGNVIWSEQAVRVRDTLPAEAREALDRRLEYLEQMPRMYQMAVDDRFPGCRSFWLEPTYRVFYMVGAGTSDVYLAAILVEEVDPRVE